MTLNIYGTGAPKTASTSLNGWLAQATNHQVFEHDAIYSETVLELTPNKGQVWTGGAFWSPNLLEGLDPNGLRILAVRHKLEDWAWSFFSHFYLNPKIGMGRVLALWPSAPWQQVFDYYSMPDRYPFMMAGWHPMSSDDETILLHGCRNFSDVLGRKAAGVAIEHPEALEEVLLPYVKQHVALARCAKHNPERDCVISIDEGQTEARALAGWLQDRLPPESLVEGVLDLPWPHLRKTPTETHDRALADVPDVRSYISSVCEKYQVLWEDEVVSQIMGA